MFDRLEAIERRYEELNNMIALPELSTNPSRLQALAQEQASLDEAVHKYRLYKAIYDGRKNGARFSFLSQRRAE